MTKVCSKCGVEKGIDNFGKYNKGKYIKSYCKICSSELVKLWKKNNPEKVRENKRKYHAKYPHKKAEERRRYLCKIIEEDSDEYNRIMGNQRELVKLWKKNNPEKVREQKKRHIKKKLKISHTLKEISNIFTSKIWPYTTEGKNEVSAMMKEIMGDVNPIQKNSFLSMPNLGRELNLLQDVIRFEDSVGIERDDKLFRSIQRAFAKFFPSMKVEKDCINNYAINTDKLFDVAHLDYNGFLIQPHIDAAKKLIGDGTMTFVTLNMHSRFEKMENYKPLEELTSIGNVVFEKEYYGKRKCPMITLGLTGLKEL